MMLQFKWQHVLQLLFYVQIQVFFVRKFLKEKIVSFIFLASKQYAATINGANVICKGLELHQGYAPYVTLGLNAICNFCHEHIVKLLENSWKLAKCIDGCDKSVQETIATIFALLAQTHPDLGVTLADEGIPISLIGPAANKNAPSAQLLHCSFAVFFHCVLTILV